MAVTVLGEGTDDDGAGDTFRWQVDYDSVGETIGTTLVTTGTDSEALLIVKIPSLSKTYTLDCRPFLNQGRVVLGGPGSVIGNTTPIPPGSFPLPPFGKGVAPPYEIDFAWHQ